MVVAAHGLTRKRLRLEVLPPNEFGLYDMVGNVFEWTEDCAHDNYDGAPTNGSAWMEADNGNCSNHILRGGSYLDAPDGVRSALRVGNASGTRLSSLGFRVGRTLLAP